MSVVQDLNAVSGWRLLLYALLGGYIVGVTGSALNDVIRGPKDISIKLPDGGSASATKPTKTSGVDVAGLGFSEADIDQLATDLAATYGPAPALEGITAPVDGAPFTVGSAAPYVLGVVAAVAAIAFLVHRSGGVPIKPQPIEVKPVEIKVTPALPASVNTSEIANLAKQVMAQASAFVPGAPAKTSGDEDTDVGSLAYPYAIQYQASSFAPMGPPDRVVRSLKEAKQWASYYLDGAPASATVRVYRESIIRGHDHADSVGEFTDPDWKAKSVLVATYHSPKYYQQQGNLPLGPAKTSGNESLSGGEDEGP